MKKYVACALVAVALALNTQAKDKDKEKYAGPVTTVPDNGGTAVLLGLGIVAIALMHRKKSFA
jgi:hypothetical protein